MLASVIRVDARNIASTTGIEVVQDFVNTAAELQLATRRSRFNIVAGAGYYNERRDVDTSFNFHTTDTVDATNAYVYASVPDVVKSVELQVGASYDYITAVAGILDHPREQLNPKLGIVWDVTPSLTLRGAAFRTVKRRFFTSQTLEPTQIAGFAQFFDDFFDGTDAWTYGAGIDAKLPHRMMVGIEGSDRELDVPQGGIDQSWHEQLGRAYWYWAPTQSLGLSLSYEYERQTHDPLLPGIELFEKVKTQSVPLRVTYAHRSGVSLQLTATAVKQEGVFYVAPFFSGIAPQSDDFAIVDAAIAFRLPRRAGLISLEVRNLLDKQFHFQETDLVYPRFARDRTVLLRAILSF